MLSKTLGTVFNAATIASINAATSAIHYENGNYGLGTIFAIGALASCVAEGCRRYNQVSGLSGPLVPQK